MARWGVAEIIEFMYPFVPPRTVPSPTAPGHTGPRKEMVLVLNQEYKGMLHGVDLMMLSPAEREVIDAVFDPRQRGKPHRIPLVNDVLRRMDPIEAVHNPVVFYVRFVKPFLRGKDAYRTYHAHVMTGITLVRKIPNAPGRYVATNPLFKKGGEGKPTTEPQGRAGALFRKVMSKEIEKGKEKPDVDAAHARTFPNGQASRTLKPKRETPRRGTYR